MAKESAFPSIMWVYQECFDIITVVLEEGFGLIYTSSLFKVQGSGTPQTVYCQMTTNSRSR